MGDIEKNLSDENITRTLNPPVYYVIIEFRLFFIDLRRTFEK